MSKILHDIVVQNRRGVRTSIPSVCSAHPEVLMASLQLAADLGRRVVIEATSNQVNQFGGYTGMTALDFVCHIQDLVDQTKIDPDLVILGGDHLGPQVWKSERKETAMAKAHDLVADYVRAGIRKIHLDCSEGCSDDPASLDDATVAARAAQLARTCKDAAADPSDLVFVIGTEVPPPGGARLDDNGHIVSTRAADARATVAAHKAAFATAGVADLWPQVMGLVVQPGVEFGPDTIHALPTRRDPGLRAVLCDHDAMCLEAHSTDYQQPEVFGTLADLGFAFQKVGPALTFAWRRALYALDQLLGVLRPATPRLPMVLERAMRDTPKYWTSHYPASNSMLWHFGYADRIRYYWPVPEVRKAVGLLLSEIDALDIPDHVFAEVFSDETLQRAPGLASSRSLSLARAEVQIALRPYFLGADRD